MTREILYEEIDGETVLLDLTRGEYLSLNSTGSIIWKSYQAGLSLEKIATAVSSKFGDEAPSLIPWICEFIEELKKEGLIEH